MDVLFLEILLVWVQLHTLQVVGNNAGMGNIGCAGAVHNAAADVREVEAAASANFPPIEVEADEYEVDSPVNSVSQRPTSYPLRLLHHDEELTVR